MNDITLHRDPADLAVMPVMDLAQAGDRYNAVVAFVRGLMHEGTDFGIIPGTGDKKVLLKPGAEKLTTFFGLTKRFTVESAVEDWSGDAHGGEPLFHYTYRCQLWRGDLLVAEADGSCNSRESKYRWRKGERVCPACGQATIIKGKAEYGGGWLCFAKRGGCGAKYQAGDQAIESQEVGRVANPDVADQVNTIQKMAQKRALIAATLLAVNASEFFTQDMEDFVDGVVVTTTARAVAEPSQARQEPQASAAAPQRPAGNGGSNGYQEPDRKPAGTGPNDVAHWIDIYTRCTNMDDVTAADTALATAPVRFQRKPEVIAAREKAVAEISAAAADWTDADLTPDDALAPGLTEAESAAELAAAAAADREVIEGFVAAAQAEVGP